MTSMRRWIAWLVAMAAIPANGPAKPPTRPEAAIRMLATAQGEDLEAAMQLLKGRPDLLKAHAGAIERLLDSAPSDPDVAARVLALVRERADEGCRFIARMIQPRRVAFVSEVVNRYALLPQCDALRSQVSGILAWVPDPETSAIAARLCDQVIGLVRETRESSVPEAACRFVLTGPEGRRRDAIEMVLAAAPPWAERCLIRAYHDEVRSNGPVRADLLQAVARLGGVDSVPTLIVALENPEDREAACGLLKSAGTAGLSGLLFAVRTSQTPEAGVAECLMSIGPPAVGLLLPLLDHPADGVRSFVVKFLERHQDEEALADLLRRYEQGRWAVPRTVLLDLIGRYPLDRIHETITSALRDDDEAIRLQALAVIERRQDPDAAQAVLASAEDDPSDAIRIRALEAAWHLGVEGLAALAVRMVQYEKPEVVAAAAKVLGFTGGPEAVAVLDPLRHAREPAVAEAARTALWVLTYRDPTGRVEKYQAPAALRRPKGGRDLAFGGGRAEVFGKKGPLVVALPGGPGMNFDWLYPVLDDLAGDAVVALLWPDPADSPGRVVRPALLRALLEAVQRPKGVLLSQGLGGTAALWLTVLEPDAVQGVVAIAAPLPGTLDAMDDAMREGLPEPFKSLAAELVATQAAFRPEVLDRDLARVMAPALVARGQKPSDLLAVSWDLRAWGQAYATLSRPEVRYSPAEFSGPVLLLEPMSRLQGSLQDTFRGLTAQAPDRVVIEDVGDCGFLPQTGCTSRVRRLIEKFVDRFERD